MTEEHLLLRVDDLKKHYFLKQPFRPKRTIRALDGVSFELYKNETLAVVGESGCGKSTLAKILMQLEPQTSGQMDLLGLNRRAIQMVFQDPYGSLNPRKKVKRLIGEPLKINSDLGWDEIDRKVHILMEQVGLRREQAERYPHMFSGGQRQRIGIARALILDPKLIICDEPVSALDISIQAQVLNLLTRLQDERGISFIFISHDLSVVKHISHRVMVMYLGKIVEMGTREQIFGDPQHPYTRALLASTPNLQKGEPIQVLKGELPSPLDPPPGCAFHKRCPMAKAQCTMEAPVLKQQAGRSVACHLI